MKEKWYRKGLVKWILIALAHVAAVLLIISMIWILAFPSAVQYAIEGKDVQYEDSQDLSDRMFMDSTDILIGIRAKNWFETDGSYDADKIVDVKNLSENGIIDGENTYGLAYTLGDLDAWQESYYEDGNIRSSEYGYEPEDSIIVCRKPDKTYDYYYYSDFKEKIDDGQFRFIMESEDRTAYDILQMLKDGEWYESDSSSSSNAVLDEENQVKYVTCWNYDGFWLEEEYAPVGAENVLEIVNTNPEWNGKLEEAYNQIESALASLNSEKNEYDMADTAFAEGNTNLTYLYVDKDEKKVYTNCGEYENYEDYEQNIEAMKRKTTGKYVVVMPKLGDFDSNIQEITANNWYHQTKALVDAEDFVYAAVVDSGYPVQDLYYEEQDSYRQITGKGGWMLVAGVLSALVLFVAIVWLTVVAGRRPEDDELHLNVFDRWKTELAAALVIGVWIAGMMLTGTSLDRTTYSGVDGAYYSLGTDTFVFGGIMGLITCLAFLTGYLSLVRRIKARTLWKDSLLRWLIGKFRIFIRHLPIVWKYVLGYLAFVLSQFLLWTSGSFFLVMVGLAAMAAAFLYILYQAVGKKKIRDGILRIAGGEVDYKIPLEGLKGDQLEIAERINSIGDGLDAALEASMKTERLKTDLITNVSHDIKTPLTSIINYIDLLKRENIQDEKIQGYLKVLEQKAQRLKNLTEDVVEASKVSSGNITLECMNLNLVEMVQQTSGEFAEKFEARNLKEVLHVPDEPAVIWADGRRMWRILENIYNNVAKYAMEGTRVYADLSQTEDQVVFSLKNISEQPLNINADELTERFIRGDVSRSTEGSGLGLSIAKNLAQLMGGKFELYLDGDLFRVTITFARVKK